MGDRLENTFVVTLHEEEETLVDVVKDWAKPGTKVDEREICILIINLCVDL
jgi:hypothetical protein